MKKPNFLVMNVMSWICTAGGAILFSQGISFAMPWGERIEPDTYHLLRNHAFLLSIAGIGLFAAGILGIHLTAAARKILELESNHRNMA